MPEPVGAVSGGDNLPMLGKGTRLVLRWHAGRLPLVAVLAAGGVFHSDEQNQKEEAS